MCRARLNNNSRPVPRGPRRPKVGIGGRQKPGQASTAGRKLAAFNTEPQRCVAVATPASQCAQRMHALAEYVTRQTCSHSHRKTQAYQNLLYLTHMHGHKAGLIGVLLVLAGAVLGLR